MDCLAKCKLPHPFSNTALVEGVQGIEDLEYSRYVSAKYTKGKKDSALPCYIAP